MVDQQTSADFERALRKAFLRDLRSFFRRQSNRLVAYHDVQQRITPEGQRYRGVEAVPIRQIVGSFDRYRDFDRTFLPKGRATAGRWRSIDRAFIQSVHLPPIQLYQIGEIYFVKDGNHRVSVARERGAEFIDAEITEATIRAPLIASMSPGQLLIQIEYAEFLRRTDLDRTRPDHDIRPSELGRYEEMIRHIEEYRSTWLPAANDRDLKKSAVYWYDEVYLPIVVAMRSRNVLRHFPERSEADGYLWVMSSRDTFQPRSESAVAVEVTAIAEDLQFHPTDVVTVPAKAVAGAAKKSVDWAARLAFGRRDDEESANG